MKNIRELVYKNAKFTVKQLKVFFNWNKTLKLQFNEFVKLITTSIINFYFKNIANKFLYYSYHKLITDNKIGIRYGGQIHACPAFLCI